MRRHPYRKVIPGSSGLDRSFVSRLRFGAIRCHRAFWSRRPELTAWIKRLLDIALSGTALLLASPLFLLVGAAIRWDSPGPVFFRQVRVGKGGRLFLLWKFRTMFVDAEQRMEQLLEDSAEFISDGVRFKMKHDPRITRVGKLLRMTSMDELPQLWNVLRGEMSLVGPRPPIPKEVALYSSHERRRLEVIPGLTCIWQVSGRSLIPFEEQVEMDLAYVHGQSVGLDVSLLLRTIPAVLTARGAF